MARQPYVYMVRPVGAHGPVKIGWSQMPIERLSLMRVWSPLPLEFVATWPGDASLERRLHARFCGTHSHGEWFHVSSDLLAVIEQMNDGSFDESSLPEPGRRIWARPKPPESVEAARMTAALTRLMQNGVEVPEDVMRASHTYKIHGEEKSRRRALVKAFVLKHRPDLERKAA